MMPGGARSNRMKTPVQLADGSKGVHRYKMTCKWHAICPLRSLENKGLIGHKWRKEYCETTGNWRECKRYQMEDKGFPHADNMMPDGCCEDLDDFPRETRPVRPGSLPHPCS